jgi:hypothetical protein
MWTRYEGSDIPQGLGRAPVWNGRDAWLARNDAGVVMSHAGVGAKHRTPHHYGPWSPGRDHAGRAPAVQFHRGSGALGAGPSPGDYGAWTPRRGSGGLGQGQPARHRVSLGAAGSGIAVAQNTDNSGDLNVRSGPGTNNAVVGGIPHGGYFWITGGAVDVGGASWPVTDPNDPTTVKNPMPTGNPDQNAWWPAQSADGSVQGYVSIGPGSGNEQLVTLTGFTTIPGGGGGGGGGG